MSEFSNAEARRQPRSNIFVMATLASGSGSNPVKVRNLSSSGAMVEGASLPSIGQNVTLRRGSLHADAVIVWCGNGRAGLHFHCSITVAGWLPNGFNKSGQQGVDTVFQQLANEKRVGSLVPSNFPIGPGILTSAELLQIATDLESLAEALADDERVVALYGSKLQVLDLATQALQKVGATEKF